MPDIKINQKVEYNFQDYTYGDDFEFSLKFFSDDNFTIPQDVSTWSFFMDIKPQAGCCPDHSGKIETLAIGTGISYDPIDTAVINFSKKLVSTPGKYDQSVRSVEPVTLRTITREAGILKIDPKI